MAPFQNCPGTIPARFGLIWFSGFRGEDLNVIFYQIMTNLHNRYISAERKISHKNPEYMLNYSFTFRPSSVVVVRPSTFHILIFSSETTGPIATKLWWNGPWMAPFQNCVIMTNLHNRYISAERKISHKNPEYMLNYSLPCSCS
jgi:hypothetical protein